MTRKDTILIAVVINAGLLAILFTTAIIYDPSKAVESNEFVTSLADGKPPIVETPSELIAAVSTGDEVDNVLKYYTAPSSQPIIVDVPPEPYIATPPVIQKPVQETYPIVQAAPTSTEERYVEVVVKKGDVLEKIARANGTTVSAIKRANQLPNEKLSIGQVLKIPTKKEGATVAKATPVAATKPAEKKEATAVAESSGAVYYTVKSGDNPWKIAKQFNVKFEDILRLNQLDEEKARNLKVGDRIRVK